MIYWLRFTRAFQLEEGIGTELSTEAQAPVYKQL
jgi:hypothetical protein